jgi:hypothetical protein
MRAICEIAGGLWDLSGERFSPMNRVSISDVDDPDAKCDRVSGITNSSGRGKLRDGQNGDSIVSRKRCTQDNRRSSVLRASRPRRPTDRRVLERSYPFPGPLLSRSLPAARPASDSGALSVPRSPSRAWTCASSGAGRIEEWTIYSSTACTICSNQKTKGLCTRSASSFKRPHRTNPLRIVCITSASCSRLIVSGSHS